jgi:hypothetical protein
MPSRICAVDLLLLMGIGAAAQRICKGVAEQATKRIAEPVEKPERMRGALHRGAMQL